MSRIGYTVTAGGESRTVILPQDYPPEEAARQVALARAAEAGANLSGLHAMRPPRPSTTHWFVVPDEGTELAHELTIAINRQREALADR